MFMHGLSEAPLPSHVIQEEIQDILSSLSPATTPFHDNGNKATVAMGTGITTAHGAHGSHLGEKNIRLNIPSVQQQQRQFERGEEEEEEVMQSQRSEDLRHAIPAVESNDNPSRSPPQQQPLPPTSQMPSTRFHRAHHTHS
jgi:hypothetical protein